MLGSLTVQRFGGGHVADGEFVTRGVGVAVEVAGRLERLIAVGSRQSDDGEEQEQADGEGEQAGDRLVLSVVSAAAPACFEGQPYKPSGDDDEERSEQRAEQERVESLLPVRPFSDEGPSENPGDYQQAERESWAVPHGLPLPVVKRDDVNGRRRPQQHGGGEHGQAAQHDGGDDGDGHEWAAFAFARYSSSSL